MTCPHAIQGCFPCGRSAASCRVQQSANMTSCTNPDAARTLQSRRLAIGHACRTGFRGADCHDVTPQRFSNCHSPFPTLMRCTRPLPRLRPRSSYTGNRPATSTRRRLGMAAQHRDVSLAEPRHHGSEAALSSVYRGRRSLFSTALPISLVTITKGSWKTKCFCCSHGYCHNSLLRLAHHLL